MLAVFKPSGLAVHQGWVREPLVLVDLVREHLSASTVYPIHRLDRATSGVVLFGKSPESAAALQSALDSGQTRKLYLALVRGVTKQDDGFIDHPVPRSEEGERVEAQTAWWRLAHSPTEPRHTSLICAKPITGRLHQIRRHFKHISHPIIGDANYGKGPLNREFKASYGLERLALHARALSLPHPQTQAMITFEAALPEDLSAPLERMGFEPGCWGEGFNVSRFA